MSEGAISVGLPLAGALRLFSDDRLVERAVTGDQRAFAAIYGRYHRDLYRFSLAIVGDADDAADALQATMVKAMRALPGERRRIQLRPWLYRIAHNESVELLRQRRAADPLGPEQVATSPQPHEEAEQRSRLRTLLRDLEELPERQRGALLMRELSGFGFEEIGLALGASPAVIRQTIYEARLSLRQMEEGRDLDCESVTLALSSDDRRVSRRRDLRAHLRQCQRCRGFQRGIEQRRSDLAAIAPLPAVVAVGILKGAAGSLGLEGAAGLGGSLAGGLASGLGASAVVKSTATVAVVATLGVSVADRAGLVTLGDGGGAGVEVARSTAPVGEAAGGGTGQPAPGEAGGGYGSDVSEDGGPGLPADGAGGPATHRSGSHSGHGSDPTAPLAEVPGAGRGGEGASGPEAPSDSGAADPAVGGGGHQSGGTPQAPGPPPIPPSGSPGEAPVTPVPVPQPPGGPPGQPPVPEGSPEPPAGPGRGGHPNTPPQGPPDSAPSGPPDSAPSGPPSAPGGAPPGRPPRGLP